MIWHVRKHAAGCGLTVEQIKDELLNGRDRRNRADLVTFVHPLPYTDPSLVEIEILVVRNVGEIVVRIASQR